MLVDWFSPQNEILINPKYSKLIHEKIAAALQNNVHLESHICVATSGSTAQVCEFPKMVLLAKESVLISAQAVNFHLEANQSDRWIHALPDFHVGGLGIWARSLLSKARVHIFQEKWNPFAFYECVVKHAGTLTALVPTQIFDLVMHKLSAPPSLRAIVVGGGKLTESLYLQARSLGWCVLPSYGLTECASQVATAGLDSLKSMHYPSLSLLSHVEASIYADRIALKSPSLLTAYLESSRGDIRIIDPKRDGLFQTEDRGAIVGQTLEIFGRDQNFFKIGGESVDFANLEKILEQVKMRLQICFDVALIPFPDERLGHVIHFVTDAEYQQVRQLVEIYNISVLPYEKIRKVHCLPFLPRSATGKLLRGNLVNIIESS
ncbi:AMP-binding protein [Parachlamydia acanthamoebae]|uniref:AMP-binding protein n=1 Tax=Parachlamydia acanthamoebae TaxID=83552 RepID=UPI0007517316|nr:AMP-binding protein [Parachlamydia acanthamoebae]